MSDSNHHVYLLKANREAMLTEGPDDQEGPVLAAHYQYLMQLGAAGKLGLFGRTANSDATTFGLVLINTGDEVAARAIMHNDPAVSAGVMTAELYPFRLAFQAGDS